MASEAQTERRVEYSSNNSGGRWWLNDDNWRALEEAGWSVDWVANREISFRLSSDKEGRWLGALATSAERHGLSMRDAVAEWERVTGLSSTEAGCACCGQPHNFTEYDEAGRYVSMGPDISYSASWAS